MTATLDLAKKLIARPSITPDDAGCQNMIGERLAAAGFTVENLPCGRVSNLWARHGNTPPVLVFAGHTDVVPPGPEAQWLSPPFTPEIRDEMLYGRGAADMKGGLAAMLTAAVRFLDQKPHHLGTIAFLLTSDEEGPAVDGTAKVVETLKQRGESIDWCVIGEPSSTRYVGDTVRHGRRGSLSGRLTIIGTQGHVAYPGQADNPIHRAVAALDELCGMDWDSGDADFPPTSFQISNFTAGTGAGNVIPGEAVIEFNFRYCPVQSAENLEQQVNDCLRRYMSDYSIEWWRMGQPFITRQGRLPDAVSAVIKTMTGNAPLFSTGGGTSDGRFIAPTGAQVVELGAVNRSIHKVNECIPLEELEQLSRIYEAVIGELLGN